MKKFSLIIILFCSCLFLNAQNVHVVVLAGVSNYQGDLQAKRFTFSQSHGAIGFGGLYEISDKFFVRGLATFAKVSADDKKSPSNQKRNLSFSSPIYEAQLGLEYDIFSLYQKDFTPFIFASLAAYYFNPSALDSAGKKVFLRPLSTEGQGFTAGRTVYSNKQISLPFGGGIKVVLSEDIRLRFEIGLRYLFTDYLDDVSTTYPNAALLLANKGQQAVAMSYRGYELKPGTAYTFPTGIKRGNPGVKDFYYITAISASFRIGQRYDDGGMHGKAQYGCPRF